VNATVVVLLPADPTTPAKLRKRSDQGLNLRIIPRMAIPYMFFVGEGYNTVPWLCNGMAIISRAANLAIYRHEIVG